MIDLSILDDTVVSVDGKLTFAGVIHEYFDYMCDKYYWNSVEHTQKPHLADYVRRIIPYIECHDELPIEDYIESDYKNLLDILSGQGYSPGRLADFMRLIYDVADVANDKLGIENVLWGTLFEIPPSVDDNGKKEFLKLKKSLNPKQEVLLYRFLTKDVEMRGELFGVYLMLVFGLRDGEACVVQFKDIITDKNKGGFHSLLVYKTIESKKHRIISSGKTKNADRILPIPDEVYNFFMKRRQYLINNGVKEDEVDELTIACVNNHFYENCIPDKITKAAKQAFREVGIKPEILSYLDYEIAMGEIPAIMREKNPTAYMLRRNFATQLSIVGMNDSEIQYLLGHDVTDIYETRNEFNNQDSLWHMYELMNERAIYKRKINRVIYGTLDDAVKYDLYNCSQVMAEIEANEGDIVDLEIVGCEPNTKSLIRIDGKMISEDEIKHYYCNPKYRSDRTINILEKYHKVYMRVQRG